ncbi:hypothetical protein PSPO01_04815 [Paraphaeosphaeria sporulosa]
MTSQEEVDRALALSLHKELNGFDVPEDAPAVDTIPLVSLEDTSGDADLAPALHLEWQQENSIGDATVYD